MWLPQPLDDQPSQFFSEGMIRQETHFLLPRSEREALLALLSAQLRPVTRAGLPPTYRVESTYFDSPGFDWFRTHQSPGCGRCEVRVRRYGTGSDWFPELFVELKARDTSGWSRKSRFKVEGQDLEHLQEGRPLPISTRLRILNAGMEMRSLLKTLQRTNRAIEENGLRPVCTVRFQRQSFGDHEIRISLDEQLLAAPSILPSHLLATSQNAYAPESASELVSAAQALNRNEAVILDLKHCDDAPEWMMQWIGKHGGQILPGFSKFSFGICNLLKH